MCITRAGLTATTKRRKATQRNEDSQYRIGGTGKADYDEKKM